MDNRIRLPNLYEPCFEVVDIIRFKLYNFEIYFSPIDGAVSKGVEELNRGRFGIFDEIG